MSQIVIRVGPIILKWETFDLCLTFSCQPWNEFKQLLYSVFLVVVDNNTKQLSIIELCVFQILKKNIYSIIRKY